jgi:LmbE family N-acetylglucosaminyl deacetylase
MNRSENHKKRLLVVFAHPDDESFGIAGTLARYVVEGVGVHLICATNGDVGSADPEFMRGYSSVAELRLSELRCAQQMLRLAGVTMLGYRDSGVAGSPENEHPDSLVSADLREVAAHITRVIREVQPHVVVTFDPVGGYGHPDHIAIHRATMLAFEQAPDRTSCPEQINEGLEPCQPQKLYYATWDRRWLRFAIRLMPLFGQDPSRMGRNQDIDLRSFAYVDSPVHARINVSRYIEIAERARQCHASQLSGLGIRSKLLARLRSLFSFGSYDLYTRAYPPVGQERVRERDLFAGVVPD